MAKNHNNQQADERVQLQQLKYESEAWNIVIWLLLASLIVKTYVYNVPSNQTLPEIVILMFCLFYPTLRLMFAGEYNPDTKEKRSTKAGVALGILGYSLGMAAFVGVLNYSREGYRYQGLGDWHFWMVPIVTFIGVAIFAAIGYGIVEIAARESYRRIQKRLGEEYGDK